MKNLCARQKRNYIFQKTNLKKDLKKDLKRGNTPPIEV